ncbi:hypothetical protein Tco_1062417 [Tanacetum coccineum]
MSVGMVCLLEIRRTFDFLTVLCFKVLPLTSVDIKAMFGELEFETPFNHAHTPLVVVEIIKSNSSLIQQVSLGADMREMLGSVVVWFPLCD